MSIEVIRFAWRAALPRGEKYVLLALSDLADDRGCNVYPSVGYLMWRTDYGERQLQRLMRLLESRGILVPLAHQLGGRAHRTEYRIIMANIPLKQDWDLTHDATPTRYPVSPFHKLSTQRPQTQKGVTVTPKKGKRVS